MSYETSYDIGLKPFNHDKQRGKWSQPSDFVFACIGHAFKADTLLFYPVMLFRQFGFYALVPYFVILAICVVPIIFIQSFLGQFSGTGFISVFRIAPLFKGIGYVSVALNLIILAYYSIYGSIPLFYIFHTLQRTIPWSCEGSEDWLHSKKKYTTHCSMNTTTARISAVGVPSIQFFQTHLNTDLQNAKLDFSWLLMVCTFIVWIMVLLVCLRPVKSIGRIIKYSYLGIIGILSLILIRFLFLPNALVGLSEFFVSFNFGSAHSWITLPWMVFATLGPGWGSILSMASYNDFKANIYSYSWIISIAQLGMMLGITFMSLLMWGFLIQNDAVRTRIAFNQYTEFLIMPTALTYLELPHFWTMIFFVMLLLGTLNLLVVQLLSVLTSIFDEFETLRARKTQITIGTVAALALSSIYFCSNHGIEFMDSLGKGSAMTQMLLNFLLVLVVLWIYGRERFERDVNFMTSRLYSIFTMNIMRFVTPLVFLLGLITGVAVGVLHIIDSEYTVLMCIIAATLTLVPWCLIPWYCILRLMQTSGAINLRFKRCVRPTDWYPADPHYKQRYEETFSNSEVSHHLTMTPEE